jgi:hypothetical protein
MLATAQADRYVISLCYAAKLGRHQNRGYGNIFLGKVKSCQGQRRGKIPGRREPLGESTFKIRVNMVGGGGHGNPLDASIFRGKKSVNNNPLGESIFKIRIRKL